MNLTRLTLLMNQTNVKLTSHFFHILLIFIPFSFPLILPAQQQLQFNHYSLDQGYYDGIETAIFQDSYRYLWIGTADGLYRFDGYRFMEYRKNTDVPGALKNNVITAIEEDKYGRLWIGTEGDGLSLFDRENNEFIHFRHDPNDPHSISSYFISDLLKDKKGNFWIATEKKGLSLLQYDVEADKYYFHNFGPLSQDPNLSAQNEINQLFEDHQGNLWVGTNLGLARIQYDSLEIRDVQFFLHDPLRPDASLADDMVYAIEEDRQGRLWIGTAHGLSCMDPATGRISNFRHEASNARSLSSNEIRCLEIEDEDRMWVGTDKGLNLFNIKTHRSRTYYHQPQHANSISGDLVMRLFKDDQGNVWAGTWGGALNRISPLSRQFTHFPHIAGEPNSLSAPMVKSITEDENRGIWIATSKGLDRFDKTEQAYTHYEYDAEIPETEAFADIFGINNDRNGHIWIGTKKGAFRFDPVSGQIKAFKHQPDEPASLPKGTVWDILEDQHGLIWMGIYGAGIACWDPLTEQMTVYRHDPNNRNSLSDNRVMAVYEDHNRDLWIGTYEGGLTWVKRNPDGSVRTFERFLNDTADPSSISSNVVWSIMEGLEGNLWIGTGNGLNSLDLSTKTFQSYKESDGLANNFVFGLLQGKEKRIWLSTNRSLSVFDPSTKAFQNFDIRDGLQQNEFNRGACWQGQIEGELFFGGVNGMILIQETAEVDRPHLPRVSINKMVVYRSDHELNSGKVDYGVGFKKGIQLAHNENTLEFEFTALNFINGDKNNYSYRLKGQDSKWINLGSNNTIRFGGLSPGQYTLEVRAANIDGDWNSEAAGLDIFIQYPWWDTVPARAIYLLLAVLLLIFIYRFIISKKLAERESERLREQDAFKTKLYTDITHEFRTPLTVISGMTDLIKGNEKARLLIKRNSQSLLNLVNQMLELRKLESGALTFNSIQADIVRFTRYTLEPFYELAGRRGIEVQLFSSNNEIWMDFDPEVMHRIIANLVSNAIKYNKEAGRVDIQLSSVVSNHTSRLLLVVKDTGIGIPKEKLDQVFERFYQVRSEEAPASQGTGIGLALVKEYVEALDGFIDVDSQVAKGTVFKIILPISKEAEKLAPTQGPPHPNTLMAEPEIPSDQENDIPQESINPEQARVLIVEDNPDVIYYLKNCLSGFYNVLVEDNGADGVKKALEEVPDLIISDLMMPQKDGYQLVDILKNDIRTSHVPIILLTAKADFSSKMKGLGAGADAYLTKPFNTQELLLRVSNLMELRANLQKRYLGEDTPKNLDHINVKKEDDFILQVRQCIKNNLEDPDFGVKALCQEVGLSRTQLHNKLKALVNRSTAIYIRYVRLKEAQHLLETTNMNIAEIAYKVGFNDPNYFSRTFNKEFGASPSQFRAKNT